MSKYENFINMDSDGKYRGPNALRKLRIETWLKHCSVKDEQGLTLAEKEFQSILQTQSKRRFTRPDHAENLESVYLYLGDDSGYIKVWDLSLLLDQCGIQKEVPFIETDLQFYPNRSEKIDVSPYAKSVYK